MARLSDVEQTIVDALLARRGDLRDCVEPLTAALGSLVESFGAGGKFLVCGNGGSQADAMHIVGELCKSFARKRPVPPEMTAALEGLPWGDELAVHLEVGLPAIALGLSASLKTAVENDSPLRDVAFAQETYALAKRGDVFMAISTSGDAANCQMAMSVAQAIGCTTIAMTGPHGGKLAMHADITIKAPGGSTEVVQEAHLCLYHTLCLLVEAHFFPDADHRG